MSKPEVIETLHVIMRSPAKLYRTSFVFQPDGKEAYIPKSEILDYELLEDYGADWHFARIKITSEARQKYGLKVNPELTRRKVKGYLRRAKDQASTRRLTTRP